MANELNIALPTSGLTVTAQRYQSGSAVGSAISLTEVGSTGFYSGNMTGSGGTYQLAFRSAGANVGSGSIVWSGAAEVPVSTFNPSTDTVANVTLCATTTTLTNAPTVPTASAIASQVRTELSVELARVDASVSSRLAGSAYTAPTTPPTAAEIATAVEGSLLNEADGQAVLNALVGAIGNTNLSEVSLVAAVRADLERTGGKLDSIPTTAAPSASAVAGAVRTELGTELGRIDAAVSTRLASASYTAPTTPPTAAQNASAVRTELSTELGRVDAAVSTRLASSAYTAPANSDISAIKSKTDNLPASPAATGDIPSANIAAIKAKTDLLNTDRLANVATTNIVGTLLAQANS